MYFMFSSDMWCLCGSFGFVVMLGMFMVVILDGIVNSCMFEEDKDVVIQFMCLGEIFMYGWMLVFIMDDIFSGRVDVILLMGVISEVDSDYDVLVVWRQKFDVVGYYKKVFYIIESYFVGFVDGVDMSGEDGYCLDSVFKFVMVVFKLRIKFKVNMFY